MTYTRPQTGVLLTIGWRQSQNMPSDEYELVITDGPLTGDEGDCELGVLRLNNNWTDEGRLDSEYKFIKETVSEHYAEMRSWL